MRQFSHVQQLSDTGRTAHSSQHIETPDTPEPTHDPMMNHMITVMTALSAELSQQRQDLAEERAERKRIDEAQTQFSNRLAVLEDSNSAVWREFGEVSRGMEQLRALRYAELPAVSKCVGWVRV